MNEIDDISAEFRALALAAGLSPEELDGPPKCFLGCGAVVDRVAGACKPCESLRANAEHVEAVKRAWATVPTSLRWVALEHARLAAWVTDKASLETARHLAINPEANPFITLTGAPGAGKTTLACAILREWMRHGAKPDAPRRQKRLARGARFASAQDIVQDRTETRLGEHVVSLDLAYNASVLVLDEIGRGKDTHGVIFSILHERHRERRPTIMTTPYANATELATETRDGGLARRVFDDGVVINLSKEKT